MKFQLVIALVLMLQASVFGQNEMKWSPPIVSIDSCLFTDSAKIELFFGDTDAQIMFSINEDIPIPYESPIYISETSKIQAFVQGGGLAESDHISEMVIKNGIRLENVVRITEPSEKYPETNEEITNHTGASESYFDPGWVGYDADSIVFEFTTYNQNIKEFGVLTLSDEKAWILPPTHIHAVIRSRSEGENITSTSDYWIEYSDDLLTSSNKVIRLLNVEDEIRDMGEKLEWRIVVYSDTLPKGHPGEGKKAWVFIDELILN